MWTWVPICLEPVPHSPGDPGEATLPLSPFLEKWDSVTAHSGGCSKDKRVHIKSLEEHQTNSGAESLDLFLIHNKIHCSIIYIKPSKQLKYPDLEEQSNHS